jgi:hypothetical protein
MAGLLPGSGGSIAYRPGSVLPESVDFGKKLDRSVKNPSRSRS